MGVGQLRNLDGSLLNPSFASRLERATEAIWRLTEAQAGPAKEGGRRAPVVGLVLGSGLGGFADEAQPGLRIPYADIPGFPRSTVPGHAGQLILGDIEGVPICAMQGRVHYYEGHGIHSTTFPIWTLAALGVKNLIFTNAAGGVNTSFTPGDLMIIKDHINLLGVNPLMGPAGGQGLMAGSSQFVDMFRPYSHDLMSSAQDAAAQQGLALREGVYAAYTGPSYETPAEIRYLRKIGADAVGMSTVPEVIVARACGARVLGISCITNMAAGVLDQRLSHEEVIEVSSRIKGGFSALLRSVLRNEYPRGV